MTQTPIIETCMDDSGSVCMIYAKGRFDAETFTAAVRDWEAWDHPLDGELYPAPHIVHYDYMRCVPVPPDLRDDVPYGYTLNICKPGRGAFEVTYIQID